MRNKEGLWFWAWNVFTTVPKARRGDPSVMTEVWRNLVVISARDEARAFTKAKTIGKQQAGDAGGTLRLFGRPATQYYLGVESLGVIHDGLTDGAEITWTIRRCRLTAAMALVSKPAVLLRRARDEMRLHNIASPTTNRTRRQARGKGTRRQSQD